MNMIRAEDVSQVYSKSGVLIRALDRINLTVQSGDFVIIHGASGSGKTTLLLTLGGMLRPTNGRLWIQDVDLYGLSAGRRARHRRRHVGFMFQKFFLVPYLTARDNIRFPLSLRGMQTRDQGRIEELAERLGIAERLDHRPGELSVGEQQRVAMARAIAAEPDLILADEPTGNLDRRNRSVMAAFLEEENRRGRTILVVTHDDQLIGLGNRNIELQAGQILSYSGSHTESTG